ncbi:MAG: hypothetical protein QG608_3551 [Actinomycetota bacterium]|nr:hypothetical protein [Actinomycetota bacterium]
MSAMTPAPAGQAGAEELEAARLLLARAALRDRSHGPLPRIIPTTVSQSCQRGTFCRGPEHSVRRGAPEAFGGADSPVATEAGGINWSWRR